MTSGSPFVGRRQELQGVLEWAVTPAGPGLLVFGEAGIGKTRLISEFADMAREGPGIGVRGARCAALAGDTVPFTAFSQLLRELLAEAAPVPSPPPARRTAVFEAVRDVLGELAAGRRLVVVIEDVHWIGKSGADLLASLLRNPPFQVSFLLTSRGIEAERPWLRRLVFGARREGLLQLQRLGGLDGPAVRALLTALTGRVPSPSELAEAHAASAGSPLYLEQRNRMAQRGRDLASASLADLTTRSLLDVSDPARAVLRAVAVAGTAVSHKTLLAVVAADVPDPEAALDELVAEELLAVTGDGFGYRFLHEVHHQACYDQILPGDRMRLHAALEGQLSAGPAPTDLPRLALLAHHAAQAGCAERASGWLVRAAKAAEEIGAMADALDLYEKALELWPTRQRSAALELILKALRTADQVLDRGMGRRLAEEGLALVDVENDRRTASLLEERAAWHRLHTSTAPVPPDCRHALDLVAADAPSRERCRVQATHARLLALNGRPAAALAFAQQALDHARVLEALPEQASALVSLGAARVLTGDRAGGVELLREGCRLAGYLECADELSPAYRLLLGTHLLTVADVRTVLELAAVGRHELLALGVDDACLDMGAAVAQFELGEWAEAAELARDAAAADRGIPSQLAGLLVSTLAACRGERLAAVVEPRATDHELGLPGLALKLRAEWMAQIHLLADQPQRAADDVSRALAALAGRPEEAFTGRLLTLGLRAHADTATRGWDTGRAALVEQARAGAKDLLRHAEALRPKPFDTQDSASPLAVAEAATWTAERSRLAGDSNPRSWAEAAAAWHEVGRPFPAGYALCREAEALLLDRRRRRGAAPVLQAGLAIAERLGSARLRADFERLGRRAHLPLLPSPRGGEQQDTAPGSGPALTPRERQVLELVAQGLSNRAIAETLVISRKTVDTHVSHLLVKFDVHDRLAAAGRAERLGLLPES